MATYDLGQALGPRHRRLCTLALFVAALFALVATGDAPALAAGTESRAALDHGTFQDPGPELRPRFTWTWPGPAVEDPELRTEVEEMAAAGFGGAQLFELPSMGHPPAGNAPERLMWGTRHWVERIRAALEAGRENGFKVDLETSSGWPWSSPAVTGENIGLAAQQLIFGQLPLAGPSAYNGPPPPPDDLDPQGRRLVAVTAAQLEKDPSRTDGEKEILLDPDSTVDLTPTLDAQGHVNWEVPPGDWVLFGFWHGPTRSPSANGSAGTSGLLIDYLSRESLEAATGYLDEHLFAHLGGLPRLSSDRVHSYSLEGFEARLFWTRDFMDDFRSRRRYELARYLPALTVGPAGTSWPTGKGLRQVIYDFPGSAGERVRRDYAQTLTELWVEEHVRPLGEWAHGHGLKASGRAIGTDMIGINHVAVAKAYDIAEADHISNPTIDWMRTTASGAHLAGARKVVGEAGVLVSNDYMISLDRLKGLADRHFVGGANEILAYAFYYRFANGANWPGWSAWSSEYFQALDPETGDVVTNPAIGVAEHWTPESPVWRHLPRLADYFARAQVVLQAGRPVTDVAIYRDAYGFAAESVETLATGGLAGPEDAYEPALNSALTRTGFSFDIVNPDTLTERGTSVRGERLVVKRPGYKALIIDLDASWRIGVVDNTDAMAGPVARRLLRFASSGLPIVFVGRFPQRGVSYRNAEREDARVRAAVAKLSRSPNVRLVEKEADVPAALAELGVRTDLSFKGIEQSAEPCGFGAQCVYSVHRRTRDGDYWFLFNAGVEPARFTGSFKAGPRGPERWDPWSGGRERLGLYRLSGKRVRVPLELAPRETTVIAFERPQTEHVRSTSAEEVVVRGGRLLLRSTEGGTADASLSTGRRRTVDFGSLPGAVEPDAWELHVDGAVREGEETHNLTLSELKDWREIPELKDTSGTGTYRTRVTLDEGWTREGRGAYLELGRTEGGGVQVRVNGRLVHPAAVPPPRLDVGPFLHPGENTIEVELTTTLKNRLVEMSTHVPGYQRFLTRSETQPYGLLGPVRLVAYAERAV